MWVTSELEYLEVWADELQQRGDPWGELVTTSIAADASEDPEHRSRLRQHFDELERTVWRPRVDPLLDGFDSIHPHWQHGVLVGLSVATHADHSSEALLERMVELLRLPAARFLWLLHVDLRTSDLEVPARLLEPEIVARPRVLSLGDTSHMPAQLRPLLPLHACDVPGPFGEAGHRIAEPSRGLLSLSVGSTQVELPWARGDGGSRRHAFARLDARIRANPTRLAPADRTALARALWDRSLRVRLAALDCLAELGVEAAPLVPELVRIHHGDPKWIERALAVSARLAAQPEVVARVANNFLGQQIGVLGWLQVFHDLDAPTLNRIAAMLRNTSGLAPRMAAELRAVHQRHSPVPEPPLAAKPQHWFGRLRAWLRG